MKTHFTSSFFSTGIARRISRRVLALAVVGFLGWGIALPAGAASIWNPTLLVNTESFNTIDDGDGTTNIELRFGDALQEKIVFDRTDLRFEFSRGIFVGGNITATGALTVTGAMAGSGNLSIGGTTNLKGATTFGSTVRLNGVTYTFPGGDGSASGKVLKTNGAGQLSWSADTDTNTTYSAGQGLTLNGTVLSLTAVHSGTTITATTSLASSGTIAATNTISTRGDITLNGDNGGTDAVLTFGNDSGAETMKFNDTTERFEFSDDVGVLGDLEVTGTMSGRLLQVTGTGAVPVLQTVGGNVGIGTATPDTALDVVGTVSGSTMNASTSLTSSGTLAVEGNAAFGGTIKLNGVTYTFPGGDGSASGKVLKTNGAGQLSWSADSTASGVGSGGVIFLSPEYPHAVYFGSGSTYIGQLSLAYDTTNKENYYRWTSSKADLQDYWISIRVRVPDNFSAWDATRPVQWRYRTGSGETVANYVTMRMLDTAGAAVTLTGGANLANTSWTTATITGPEAAGTYTKSSYITLLIKLAGTTPADTNDSGFADIGFINLNWETTAP